MGWSSGTAIFDDVLEEVIDSELTADAQEKVVRVLAKALQSEGWDCEIDSRYYGHPIVQKVLRSLNPDLDWDDDEDNSRYSIND